MGALQHQHQTVLILTHLGNSETSFLHMEIGCFTAGSLSCQSWIWVNFVIDSKQFGSGTKLWLSNTQIAMSSVPQLIKRNCFW